MHNVLVVTADFYTTIRENILLLRSLMRPGVSADDQCGD